MKRRAKKDWCRSRAGHRKEEEQIDETFELLQFATCILLADRRVASNM